MIRQGSQLTAQQKCVVIAMCHDLELIARHQISLTALSTGGSCIPAMIMDRIPYSSSIPHSVCWEYPSAPLFAANTSIKFTVFVPGTVRV